MIKPSSSTATNRSRIEVVVLTDGADDAIEEVDDPHAEGNARDGVMRPVEVR